jgi:hypothetical protein
MTKSYIPYPMVLNGVFIGMLGIREDQQDYFNIPEPTAAEKALVNYQGSIKAHKRNIFSDRLDSTAPTRTKSIERVAVVDRVRRKLSNSKGGKPVKIPTELTSTPATTSTAESPTPRKASIRFTTIKFPAAASNSEISRWLNTKLASHKPSYFKTPAGASYPVTGAGAAPVTGTPTNP